MNTYKILSQKDSLFKMILIMIKKFRIYVNIELINRIETTLKNIK